MDPTVLIKDAEYKFKKESSWFSRWKSPCYDEIAELYIKAANLFKIKKQWNEAIEAYINANECYIKNGSTFETNRCYIEIAKCSRYTDMNQCKLYTTKVINNFIETGDFYRAGIHQEKLAIIYEDEGCFDEAIIGYETAIEYYNFADAKSSSRRCKLKLGDISSIQGDYNKAVTIFKSLAIECIDERILKYQAKQYYVKACISSILMCDIVDTVLLLKDFTNIDYNFTNSHEHKFLSEIVEAYKQSDVELFTSAVTDFDSSHKLDNWHVTLLLRIKTKIINDDTESSLL